MGRTENDYAAFEKAMDENGIYRVVSDFLEICSQIGADPVLLDSMLYRELGFRGQDLVDRYREGENIH